MSLEKYPVSPPENRSGRLEAIRLQHAKMVRSGRRLFSQHSIGYSCPLETAWLEQEKAGTGEQAQ
jgi:hypothetical protein